MNATPDKEPCKRSSTRSRRRMTAAEAHVEERYAKKRREIAEAREAKEREADQAVEATLIAAAHERLRSATGDMPEVKEWREGRVANGSRTTGRCGRLERTPAKRRQVELAVRRSRRQDAREMSARGEWSANRPRQSPWTSTPYST